jgi:integrase
MSDPPEPLPPALPSITRPAVDYARAPLAPATLRAYQAGWQAFAEWCQLSGLTALPAAPETVAEHLASLATFLGRASLTKRLAAIGQYHRLANHPFSGNHPVIHHTIRGIHREHGRPARRPAALATPEIKRLVAACRTRSLADLRDRALLLLGYAGALRRAELVAIAREHVGFTPEGLRLQIPRSKTDTTGQEAELGIPRGGEPETCPMRPLEAWLEVSGCRFGRCSARSTAGAMSSRRRCTRMRCGRSSAAAPHRPGSRSPGWSGCRRMGCAPASSPRPTARGRGMKRLWITRATAISGPCAVMSAAPSC